jgi:hypothetical protein
MRLANAPDYDLFYEIVIDGEGVLSVFTRKGST